MMNKIEAVGIFVKSGVSDYGYAGFTILCKRPRQDDAHIRFTLETVLDPSITVGSVVEVTGCLRGYSYKDDEDGKWKVVTYLAATKVSLAKDKMFDDPSEEFRAERAYKAGFNMGYFRGGKRKCTISIAKDGIHIINSRCAILSTDEKC